MAWKISFDKKAKKQLEKLDKAIATRILDYLQELSKLENIYSRGKALTANLAGLWRYRVGNYRIICDIQNEKLIVLVVDIDHRKDIYRD